MHGVEELQGEGEHVGLGSDLEGVERREAATRCPGEPRMAGDRGVVRGDAIGVRGDDRGDLEREGLWVGLCPERRGAARVLDRERERQAAVGKCDGVQVVAQLHCVRRGDGSDVGKDLERVPGSGGLALRRAQVGLEAVPVAAVGVAVGAQGREDGLGVPALEEQLEAPPIEESGVAGHEAARGGQLIAHGVRPMTLVGASASASSNGVSILRTSCLISVSFHWCSRRKTSERR